jgi:hypothetical protein
MLRACDERTSGMAMSAVPDATEAAEYYFTYINQVPPGDIVRTLEEQTGRVLELARGISEDRSLHRYAPDRWSIRQVFNHINDAERVFVHRAFWFARGYQTALPGFDQDVAVAAADPDARSWSSHVDEFRVVRASTIPFFQHLSAEAWNRRGIASGNPFTVRALAYVTAGHVAHHLRILQERYL